MPLSSLSSPARRLAALALLPLVGTAALVAAAPTAQAVDVSSPVVISEVYGGGGNSGAPFTNDFIELYNKGTTAVDLSTWSVQYASATGSTWTNRTNLTGTIQPQAYYLIQEGAGATPSTPLPTPDATGTIAMGGAAGKVALVKNQANLACGMDCDNATDVADFVGYGTANDFAGSGPAPAPSNTTSDQRNATASNTGNNAADFTAGAPTPKAPPVTVTPPLDCAVTPNDPACQPGSTTVQDIQGSGFLSLVAAPSSSACPGSSRRSGRPAAARVSGSSRRTPDLSRPAASSGIFVFTSTAAITMPAVGDAVLVTGRVSEFYPGGAPATSDSISITEITPTLVTRSSSGNVLPPALVITPTTVPGTYVPPLPAGVTNVESITTVDPGRSTLEFWEAHEGMRVTVNDVRVVGPGQPEFGEIYVTTKPDELRTPRGGTYLRSYAETPTGRLLILPVNGQVPAADVGDVLGGATTGPVDWSRFGGYAVAATTLGTCMDNNLQPTSATKQAADQLAIATYNVENLDPWTRRTSSLAWPRES